MPRSCPRLEPPIVINEAKVRAMTIVTSGMTMAMIRLFLNDLRKMSSCHSERKLSKPMKLNVGLKPVQSVRE